MTGNSIEQLFNTNSPPSLALVVAHPDDEVVGAGGQLRRWRHANVIYVTDGAARDASDPIDAGSGSAQETGSVRQRESVTALAHAGFRLEQIHQLYFPDRHASFDMLALTGLLTDKFFALRPKIIVTHPYEGGHPDHDATAFAVHAACDILRRQKAAAPAIVEMASYFHGEGIIETSQFPSRPDCPVTTVTLSREEQRFKRRLLDCFKTQSQHLKFCPLETERFRPAPSYDFTKPPHDAGLYYERFNWKMTGEHWRNLARATLHQLDVELGLGKKLTHEMGIGG